MFKVLLGVIVVAVSTIVVFMVIDPNISINGNDAAALLSTSIEIQDGYFSVTIEGEVSKPGSYVLKDGSLMEDLIDAAGGLSLYGDDLAYFDDADIESGATYYIPSKYDTSNVCELKDISKVNINEASLEELLEISAFTNSVANSVISYRAEHGEYRTLESLLDVYGIGNATYRKLRNYVILHE